MAAEIRMERPGASSSQYEVGRKISPFARWTKLLLNSKTGTVGFIIVVAVILMAAFAPYLAPHDPTVMDIRNTLTPPAWAEGGSMQHILGTDNLGRDVLSRLIYGAQVSLLVSGVSVVIAAFIGILLGIVCGFYGGKWFDTAIMRLVDAKMAIPGILLMLVIIGVFGSSVSTLIIVIGLTEWTMFTRLIRGEVLSIKQRDYVRAARSIGSRDRTIMFTHILPNIASLCIVVSTLAVGSNIILEASLSYLGLGIQPPAVSWGYMLNEGRDHIATSWWIAAFPGLAITITVLGIIFLGDWLRDVFDPRSQGRRS
ncbi:peptide ABC transporter permease [Xylanibacillus composti]|uniref:Peptide ABC transporter permease n=1 Tax=Xylanibacillus composti TaxID=1572762 RepID=A0A8J4H4X3_9BACL|nr:ABC transporter permease [Xylanibacillus composti]GIQ69686.1 peptide ABC transporter permease [Xylanibacillus composti]